MTTHRIISFFYLLLMAGVVAFAAYCFWQLWELRQEHSRLLQVEAATRVHLAEQQEITRENQRTLDRLRTDPAFVDMAIRRRLGYSKPEELIFRFESTNDILRQTPAQSTQPQRR